MSNFQSRPITFTQVKKVYPGGVQALAGVNLTIKPGEMVSLIGRSGAGKTTLLRCLHGLIKPTLGVIRVGGQEINNLKGKALRQYQKTVGMIFQQFNLVKRLNVLYNVLIGSLPYKTGLDFYAASFGIFTAEERKKALHCLKEVGISPYVWNRADSLSGGQQQRVAIAKILLQKPSFILADEPIASLDPYSSEMVMQLLKTINQEYGTTIILNMHYLDFAVRFSTRILGLKDGQIVFDGSPNELTEEAERLIYSENNGVDDYSLSAGELMANRLATVNAGM